MQSPIFDYIVGFFAQENNPVNIVNIINRTLECDPEPQLQIIIIIKGD